MLKNYVKLFPIFLLISIVIFLDYVYAEDRDELNELFMNTY